MKNQVNNEIQRIQKIMGVEILTEQPSNLIRGHASDAKKFLEKILKKINWRPSNLEPFIENPEVKQMLDKNLDNLTSKESKEILRHLNPSIVNHLFENGLVSIQNKQKAFGNLTQAVVNGKISFENAVNELKQAGYIKKLYNKSMSLPEELGVPPYIQSLSNSVDEKLAAEFIEYFKKIKPRWTDPIRMMEPTGFKAWRQVFFKYWQTKEEKLIELIETQADKIQVLANKQNANGFLAPEKIHHEVKTLANMIASLRTNAKKSITENLKKYIDDNPNISPGVREELKKQPYFEKLYNTLDEDVSKLLGNILEQKMTAYGKMLYVFSRRWQEGFERIGMLMTFKSPVLFSEIVTNAIRNGRTASRIERVASWAIIHQTMVPAAIALWETWRQNVKIGDMRADLLALKAFCDNGIETGYCPTQEEIDKYKPRTREDVWDNFWKNFYQANPIIKAMVGSNGRRVFDFLFFTWWDEFYQLCTGAYARNTFTFESDLDNFRKKVTGILDKIKQNAKKEGYDIGDSGWENAFIDKLRKEKQSNTVNNKDTTNTSKPAVDTTGKPSTDTSGNAEIENFFKKQGN